MLFFFFLKRKMMILSWCCFVLHSKRQVEILIVVVVKVFSYWLNVKNVCLLKMLMSKDLLYNFTFNIDVIQKFHIRSIRTQEGEVIMFCHKTNTFSFHQCGWMDLKSFCLWGEICTSSLTSPRTVKFCQVCQENDSPSHYYFTFNEILH